MHDAAFLKYIFLLLDVVFKYGINICIYIIIYIIAVSLLTGNQNHYLLAHYVCLHVYIYSFLYHIFTRRMKNHHFST